MKAIVICPDRLKALPFLSGNRPAALTPALGQSLLSHALATLAEAGAKEVIILAADRPEQIRRAVGGGERWGLVVEVVAESCESSVEEAQRKYRRGNGKEWMPEGGDVLVADRPAVASEGSPLADGRRWFEALRDWLPHAHQRRVGTRELSPGVWAGIRTRIEEGAILKRPCWLGEGVWVRAGATVGPNAMVEDDALIDHDAEVSESWIGPRTYVGAMTHVHRSLAWGRGLLNYETNSFIEVSDAFLLGDLERAEASQFRSSALGRLIAFGVFLLTSPVALVAWARSLRRNTAFFAKRNAVVPRSAGALTTLREAGYSEFLAMGGLWRRWPQLWSIVRGDFAWVGNRPITREQAAELTGEFEQLWLAAPVGLVSLADVEGCADVFGDEARAHASFYAAQAGKLDRQILRRLIHQIFANPFRTLSKP